MSKKNRRDRQPAPQPLPAHSPLPPYGPLANPTAVPAPPASPAVSLESLPVGSRITATTSTGYPLHWYLVRFNAPGWPAIPVLAMRDEFGEAAEAYRIHCGIHDAPDINSRFTVADYGPATIEKVSEEAVEFVTMPEVSPADREKAGGADYLVTPGEEVW